MSIDFNWIIHARLHGYILCFLPTFRSLLSMRLVNKMFSGLVLDKKFFRDFLDARFENQDLTSEDYYGTWIIQCLHYLRYPKGDSKKCILKLFHCVLCYPKYRKLCSQALCGSRITDRYNKDHGMLSWTDGLDIMISPYHSPGSDLKVPFKPSNPEWYKYSFRDPIIAYLFSLLSKIFEPMIYQLKWADISNCKGVNTVLVLYQTIVHHLFKQVPSEKLLAELKKTLKSPRDLDYDFLTSNKIVISAEDICFEDAYENGNDSGAFIQGFVCTLFKRWSMINNHEEYPTIATIGKMMPFERLIMHCHEVKRT